jgi:hypothetical protein
MPALRRLLFVEAAAFAVASAVHAGIVIRGFEDPAAATAEGIIGGVLLAGALASVVRPARTPAVALLVQGFGLLGSLVGLYLVVRGVGPNTISDVVFHIGIVATLAAGLVLAARSRRATGLTSDGKHG